MIEDIRSMMPDEIKELLNGWGEPAFRAKQLFSWLHAKMALDYDEMSNIPLRLREKLKADRPYSSLTIADVRISEQDGTRKYLFSLADGNLIESVLMRYHYGCTVCISTQVGCRMGCRFCASTINGMVRNLEAGEMLAQVYRISRDIGEPVSNVVVMGTGEPLDNYDMLIRFITLLTNADGLHLSQRGITVSTCGIVPRIYELADLKLQITLAISLHAVNDEKRRSLMPIANVYSIEEILKACRCYFEKTGRRLTFEYSLVAGVNDSPEDARALADLLEGINCHINLIPVNPIAERDYRQPEREAAVSFKNRLEKYGRNVTIRREMGRDIQAACGQLRKRYMQENPYKE